MSDQTIDPVLRPELWRGAVAWESEGEWRQPWRLRPGAPDLNFVPDLAAKAKSAAGVRAELITDAAALSLELELSGDEMKPVDLIIDGELANRIELRAGERNSITAKLPGIGSAVELWLPQFAEVRMMAPVLSGATMIVPAPAREVRWLTYGSSITHCRSALGPSETWPALVARARGWDLTCLGFGGQCHLDPAVIEVIGKQPLDLISMCLGINVYGSASYNARTWRGVVLDFLSRVRTLQPKTPIVIMSPIISPDRESTPNAVGMTLDDYRTGVHEVVDQVAKAGDALLTVVDGRTIFGQHDIELLPDGLHPDADGYRLMASRIGPVLEAHLG